jgi:hypothetical protein
MTDHRETEREPEGVGEGAEYEVAEQDEQERDSVPDEQHPDREPVRGNPESEHSSVAEGLDKLEEISGN